MTIITNIKLRPVPVTKHFDQQGGVDIKLEDFVLVHINYDYRYTNNAHRAWLADEIIKLLQPPSPSTPDPAA